MDNLRFDILFSFLGGVFALAALAFLWWRQYGRPPAE